MEVKTYQTIPTRVQAVQLNRWNVKDCVEWVKSFGGEAIEVTEGMGIRIPTGVLRIGYGRWVVKDDNDVFDVYFNKTFVNNYELVEDDVPTKCPTCEGAGWDWKKAAEEDLQVDDPVDYYHCEDPFHKEVTNGS